MGTTSRGWPYPEDTDPVMEGAQAIQDLAEAINTSMDTQDNTIGGVADDVDALQAALSALGITAIARGQGNVPVVAASGGVETVTFSFPAGRFSSSPSLVVTPTHQRLNVGLQTVSATSATVIFANWTGIATGSASGFHWIAVR